MLKIIFSYVFDWFIVFTLIRPFPAFIPVKVVFQYLLLLLLQEKDATYIKEFKCGD